MTDGLQLNLGVEDKKKKMYLRVNLAVLTDWKIMSIDSINHIYPTPPHEQDMTQGQFFKRSLTGLSSEFFLLLD